VDDGSTDDTFRYFRSVAPQSYRIPQNAGIAYARNAGLRMARGHWIAFIDNDITLTPGWLTRLIQRAQSDNIGIAGALPDNEIFRRNRALSGDGTIESQEIGGGCLLMPRRVFNRIGYLDTNLSHHGEDTDYCYRARLAGYRVVLIPEVVVHHQNHGTLADPELQEKRIQSLAYFRAKWLPAQSIYGNAFPVPEMGIL